MQNYNTSISETIKHGLIYSLGTLGAQAIGFLLIPLYVRVLSPSEYGTFSLILICAAVSLDVFQLGLHSAVNRSFFDYTDKSKKSIVISSAFYCLLGSVLFLVLISFWLTPSLSKLIFNNLHYKNYLFVAFCASGLEIIRTLPLIVYRVKKQSTKFITASILTFFIKTGLIIYFVVFKNMGLWGILIAGLVAESIFLPFMLLSIRFEITCPFSFSELKRMLKFGLPLVPQNLCGLILLGADSFFLKVFASTHEVGLYNIGYKFGLIIQIALVVPFSMIWTPMMLSVKDKEYAELYYSKIMTYFVLLSSFIVLTLSLMSKEIILLVSTPVFLDAFHIVPIIAASYMFMGIQNILHVGISIKKKTNLNAGIFVIAAILNCALNYLMIPAWGMTGAAIATFLSYVSISVMKYPLSMHLYKINYEWKRIILIFILCIFLYILGSVIDFDLIILDIASKTLLLMIFPVFLFKAGFFTKEEKNKIDKVFRI